MKLTKDGELRTEHGNRFHAAGPATTNAQGHARPVLFIRGQVRTTEGRERVEILGWGQQPPPHQLGDMRKRCDLPSGVRGGASTA